MSKLLTADLLEVRLARIGVLTCSMLGSERGHCNSGIWNVQVD
jgi:hypothetical protein